MHVIWLGRNNALELQLQDVGKAINHTSITRVQVDLGGGTVIDSNTSAGLFDLSNADRLVLKFGGSSITPGQYRARIIIFDPSHPDGLVWGDQPEDMVFK